MLLILACVSQLLGAGWLGRGAQLPPALRTGSSGTDSCSPNSGTWRPLLHLSLHLPGQSAALGAASAAGLAPRALTSVRRQAGSPRAGAPQGSPQWIPQTVTAPTAPPPSRYTRPPRLKVAEVGEHRAARGWPAEKAEREQQISLEAPCVVWDLGG